MAQSKVDQIQNWLINKLRYGCSVAKIDLATAFPGCSLRTIQRATGKLKAAGRIRYDFNQNRFVPTGNLKTLSDHYITEDEWQTILITEIILRNQAGEIVQDLHDFIKRNEKKLSPLVSPSRIHELVSCKISQTENIDEQTFRTCFKAIFQRWGLEFTYNNPHKGTLSKRLVAPLHLTNIQSNWHMVSWCHKEKVIKTFMPSRMSDVKIRADLPPKIVPQDELEAFLNSGFGAFLGPDTKLVKLRFNRNRSAWAKLQRWHEKQKNIFNQDGTLEVHIPVTNFIEIKKLILGFGADVKVLEPADLRDEIILEVEKMKKHY